MAAASYDFKPLNHGDTITGTFVAKYDDTKLIKDLSGASVVFTWYTDQGMGTTVHTSSSGTSEVTVDGPNGKISLQAPSAFAAAYNRLYYMMRVTESNGVLKSYLNGWLPLV